MTSRFRCRIAALSIALLKLAARPSAQAPGSQKIRAVQSAVASGSQATPEERGKLAHQFVIKWGVYVKRVYGVRVGTWAQRMVPNFATADAANFRRAVQRDTFEGAMAELSGSGQKVSDSRVITQLASMERASASSIAGITPMALGALTSDL
ncbi:MAG: hypothetical protein LH491_00335, partial [Pseudoxanthomonas sp.]|nr:hypothetical protein [Pseudoxanthomonas sp.]